MRGEKGAVPFRELMSMHVGRVKSGSARASSAIQPKTRRPEFLNQEAHSGGCSLFRHPNNLFLFFFPLETLNTVLGLARHDLSAAAGRRWLEHTKAEG